LRDVGVYDARGGDSAAPQSGGASPLVLVGLRSRPSAESVCASVPGAVFFVVFVPFVPFVVSGTAPL